MGLIPAPVKCHARGRNVKGLRSMDKSNELNRLPMQQACQFKIAVWGGFDGDRPV